MLRVRTLAALPIALALLGAASRAEAQTAPAELVWDPAWRRAAPIDAAVTGVAYGSFVAQLLWLPGPAAPSRAGGILFDDAAQEALRAKTPEGRARARSISDALVTAANVQPFFDALLVAGAARHSRDVAWQMSVINAETMGVSATLTRFLALAVARERPLIPRCEADKGYDPTCETTPNLSFPSGHSSWAFTGAGLTCAHHQHLSLYGSPAADLSACLGGLAMAAATASLRVVGDRHYSSDVIAGAMLGFAIGYGMPTLLYYRGGAAPEPVAMGQFAVAPAADGRGLALSGRF
jgi:membrane-associated phospholipid phosphatase